MARESITLLRNRGGLLPLTPQKVRKLCVTGEYAIHPYVNGQGSAEVFPNPEHIDCPLECLRRALPGVQVDYFDYLPAREPEMMLWNTFRRDMPDIESYDAVLVFTGYQPSMDSENLDRYDNHLAGFIENVLHNVVFHNPKAILILTSALASVDQNYYNAAKVDGTRSWRIFWRITLPMISPTVFYLIITGFIGAFKEYSDAVALFGTDLNEAKMNTIVGYIYDMLYGDAGGYPSYASAAAILLFAIILTITVINLLVSRRHVHY